MGRGLRPPIRMKSTRLIYPDSMPWTAEDEAKYGSEDIGEVSYEPDETPVGGWARHVVDHGVNEYGVRTRLHFQDNEIITEKTYDLEPVLKAAARAREIAENSRCDTIQSQGSIPMAELGQMLVDGSYLDDEWMNRWFRERPKLVHNAKLIKR